MKEASLSFWDACILATAIQAGYKILCSEDLSAGQRYGGGLVTNPF